MTTKMSRSGSGINWPPESGSIIQDYGSADPDPPRKIYGSTTLAQTLTQNAFKAISAIIKDHKMKRKKTR